MLVGWWLLLVVLVILVFFGDEYSTTTTSGCRTTEGQQHACSATDPTHGNSKAPNNTLRKCDSCHN